MSQTDTATAATDAPVDSDNSPRWRACPLDDMGLTRKIESRLLARGIDTIGKLADALDAGETFNLQAHEIESLKEDVDLARADDHEAPDANAESTQPPLLIEMDLEKFLEQESDADAEASGLAEVEATDSESETAGPREPSILDLPLEPATEAPSLPSTEPTAEVKDKPVDNASLNKIIANLRRDQRLREYDDETARLVAEMEAEVGRAASRWNLAATSAKAAKKAFDATVSRLRDLKQEREDSRDLPNIFDKPIIEAEAPAAGDTTVAGGKVADDIWKDYPLTFDRWGRFGLTEKDCEKLNGGETKKDGTHPLMVFGDVSRFITPHGPGGYARTLKDIKGFGEKGVERFEAAQTAFWGWWGANGAAEFAAERAPAAAAIPASDAQPSPPDAAPQAEVIETATQATAEPDAPVVDVDAQLDAEAATTPKPEKKKRRQRAPKIGGKSK